MKVFTTAAAIEEGEFNENETYQSGKIKVEDATINDHDYGAKGVLQCDKLFHGQVTLGWSYWNSG